MADSILNPLEIEAWGVEGFRLTFFYQGSRPPESDKWWSEIVGADPESANAQPRNGILQQKGPFNSGILTIAFSPGRIDWLLDAADSGGPGQGGTLGNFEVASAAFEGIAEAAVQRAPEAIRVAVGAVLTQECADRIEGYKLLRQYLGRVVAIDPEGSRDFHYQINRPQQSSIIPIVLMNRLSIWSVARKAMVLLALNDPTGPIAAQSSPVGSSWLRLQLDISTPSERTEPIPQGSLKDIIHEMIGMSKEIATTGDVP